MKFVTKLLWGIVTLGGLWLAARMWQADAPVLAIPTAAATLLAAWVYTSPRTKASRYLLPGLATFGVFVLLPLLYTVYIAFTNYGAGHLLSRARVDAWFAQEFYAPSPDRIPFRLYPAEAVSAPAADEATRPAAPATAASHRLYRLSATPSPATAGASADDIGRRLLVTPPFDPDDPSTFDRPLPLALAIVPPSGHPLPLRDVIATRPWLYRLRLAHPASPGVPYRPINLRELAPRAPLWTPLPDGALSNAVTAQVLLPDDRQGSYVDAATGTPVGPGWRVPVGFANFRSILLEPAIRAPFLRIFAWNVAFALLSVLMTFAIGTFLAVLLQWPALRPKGLYRTLLILPYAIPAFIPILVFKGLFNEGFGEINLILTSLFGIAPHWFTNPWLARLMILIVNTWLGYPYMMIIASGMLQTISPDIYEATAIDGAGPVSNFFRITLPQIVPPLFPLLIASFAFNFNNFSLIYLLTGGKPDIAGAATSAGTTDLLVSYTFRMAFQDSGTRFGFASAVASLLFLIVAGLAWLQLRTSRKPAPSP